MSIILRYKGYHARVQFDPSSRVWHGRIAAIPDLVTFESAAQDNIELEFQNAVDDYLAFCKEVGKNPEKT